MSGIMAQALVRLRRHLGLEERPVRVYEVFQMLGEVEPDVVDRLGIDVLPVEPLVLSRKYPSCFWRRNPRFFRAS